MSRNLIFALLTCCLGWGRIAAGGQIAESLELDERPALLRPKADVPEVDQDRLKAGAAYAHARLLLARNDRPAALNRLERAWRYDARSVRLLTDIVPLAVDLGRAEEAARYAILAAECEPVDGETLQDIASLLVARNELPRAARVLEQCVEKATSERATLVSRLELGRLYFVLEQYDKAADVFDPARRALERASSNGTGSPTAVVSDLGRTFTMIGEAYLQANRPDAAEHAFGLAQAIQSNREAWLLQMARVEACRKRWPEVLARLDEYFSAPPANGDDQACQLLRQALESVDRQTSADKLLTRSQELSARNPSHVALKLFLSNRLVEAGRLDQAEGLLSGMLGPDAPSAVYEGLAAIHRRRKDAPALLRLAAVAVERGNDLMLLGREQNEMLDDAELLSRVTAYGRERLAAGGQAVEPHECYAIALILLRQKQYDLAMPFYSAAFQSARVSQRVRMMESIALRLYDAEQSDRAANVFRSLLNGDPAPDRAAGYAYFLAGAAELCGDTDDALRWADEAASRQPSSPAMLLRRPWVLHHAGRIPEAERRYRELLAGWQADHKTPGIRAAVRQVRLCLASLCADQQRVKEAEELLEQVLDESPEDPSAQNDLGYLWADRGIHLQRALAMTRNAVAAEPRNPAFRDSLGWTYYRLERYGDAVRELELSSEIETPDGVVLDHLGDAYFKSNQNGKAVKAWIRAADAFRAGREPAALENVERKIERHQPG